MPTEWPLSPAESENRSHRAQVEKAARERIESAVEQALDGGTLTAAEIIRIVKLTVELHASESR